MALSLMYEGIDSKLAVALLYDRKKKEKEKQDYLKWLRQQQATAPKIEPLKNLISNEIYRNY